MNFSMPKTIEDLNEGFMRGIKQRLRNEIEGLISFPLFRITGTSMDIDKLYKQLQQNDQPMEGKKSHRPKPTSFQGQWKTRIG